MSYTAFCNECGWSEAWDGERAAQAAAVWHVYDTHRDISVRVLGARPPVDPRPVELGSRLSVARS